VRQTPGVSASNARGFAALRQHPKRGLPAFLKSPSVPETHAACGAKWHKTGHKASALRASNVVVGTGLFQQ
jgi:hypothetical protein